MGLLLFYRFNRHPERFPTEKYLEYHNYKIANNEIWTKKAISVPFSGLHSIIPEALDFKIGIITELEQKSKICPI